LGSLYLSNKCTSYSVWRSLPQSSPAVHFCCYRQIFKTMPSDDMSYRKFSRRCRIVFINSRCTPAAVITSTLFFFSVHDIRSILLKNQMSTAINRSIIAFEIVRVSHPVSHPCSCTHAKQCLSIFCRYRSLVADRQRACSVHGADCESSAGARQTRCRGASARPVCRIATPSVNI